MLMINQALKHLEHETDLCIIGGGLSGLCAAVAAARAGTRVILIQDRPVLGGNCSSEIRMWVRGAKERHNRETGILSEMEEENIYRNPTLEAPIWDSVMYGTALREKNITLMMNCSVVDAKTENGRIVSVTGWQLTTYTWHTVRAKQFADCSGDSILAPLGRCALSCRPGGEERIWRVDRPRAPRPQDNGALLLVTGPRNRWSGYLYPPRLGQCL